MRTLLPKCYVTGCATLLAIGTFLTVTTTAIAATAPPDNDNRADATGLASLPQTVRGTTDGATTETNEPPSGCASTAGSVWYSLSVGSSPPDRIGIKLSANGDLDAAVDVYLRQRSQNIPVQCRRTDNNGLAALAFKPSANTTYLIRVAQLLDSVAGTFSLQAFTLPAPPHPPGTPLRPGGAVGVLDGTLATSAAYSMRLQAGTTYKINLVKRSQGCMQLQLFAPGTGSFQADSVAELSCAGYRLFTPSVGGVWSFLITAAASNPGSQPYALHVAPATAKERAPGIFLANFAHYKGFLRGNVINDVRLFRFDVTQRSDLVLFLQAASTAPFDLKLLDDRGRYLQCNCGSTGEETIRRQISPGRYFVVVDAHEFGSGPFTLYRESRLITHVNVTFDGRGYEHVSPHTVTRLAAHVTPAVDGPVTIQVQYFDPVARWQYYRTYHGQAVHGVAEMPFIPPFVGRWRASVSYDGTKTASPATSGVAQILVAGPLVQ